MDASGSRPFKRQRVSDYPKGSVLKVEVKNFMTYKHAVIEPGPKLNLVIGPNGTGKSSLVCAMCVGLAGKTSLLGRAEDVSSFVRKGARNGWVEVTLASGDPMRPHVIRREISAESNSSTWAINRREARMRDVEELVRERLKVQLDNLCQFLPQDKVVEFARMKPVDLLEATEKAIGNGELFDLHTSLISEREKLGALEHESEALKSSLAGLRAENERSTRDVQNIQRREALLEEVELARNKVPWAQFYEKREQLKEDKRKRDEAKKQLADLQRARADDEGPLVQREAALERLKAEKKRLADAMRKADARLVGPQAGRGLEDEIMDALEESVAKEEQIAGLAAEVAERQAKMAELDRAITTLSEQVAALPPVADSSQWNEQRQQLQLQQRDISLQEGSLDFSRSEHQGKLEQARRRRREAEERLRRLQDSKMRRLQALDQRYPGIGRVWKWLQDNRGRFRGPVLGPVALEVECPNPQHQQYLEQQVGAIVWSFFVTQHREDHDLLKHECERPGGLGFKPAITNFTGEPAAPLPRRSGSASQYARYGVSQSLDQCFTAPNIVKHVLAGESAISDAFVGSQATQVDQLFRDCPDIKMVYTQAACYKRTKSAYNAAAESTLVADIRPARLLTGAAGGDEGAERQEAEAEIERCSKEEGEAQREIEQLTASIAEKKQVAAAIGKELAQIQRQAGAAARREKDLRTQLKGKQGELDRLRKQPDPRKREPKLRQEMVAAQAKAVQKALEMAQLQAGQVDSLARYAAADLGMHEAAMQVEAIKEASRARQEALARMQHIVDQLTNIAKHASDECRRLKARAEETIALTEELEEAWNALPDSPAELEAVIDEKATEADAMLIANPAALRQYNDRCKAIADQERQLARKEEARQLARAAIDDLSAQWLPRLKEVVAAVNATFSHNFQSVGCAGDVVLHEAPDEQFKNYAIEVRVKFRDSEQLMTLDASRQSGGERSVSTILYLIALQGVTVTPFRVVDEINQGMDPVNERKVFMQLVDAACREGTPQCFLLTPKLLPDLPFTRDVSVLQIMNGPRVDQVAVGFSMEALLGSARMQRLVQAAA